MTSVRLSESTLLNPWMFNLSVTGKVCLLDAKCKLPFKCLLDENVNADIYFHINFILCNAQYSLMQLYFKAHHSLNSSLVLKKFFFLFWLQSNRFLLQKKKLEDVEILKIKFSNVFKLWVFL